MTENREKFCTTPGANIAATRNISSFYIFGWNWLKMTEKTTSRFGTTPKEKKTELINTKTGGKK